MARERQLRRMRSESLMACGHKGHVGTDTKPDAPDNPINSPETLSPQTGQQSCMNVDEAAEEAEEEEEEAIFARPTFNDCGAIGAAAASILPVTGSKVAAQLALQSACKQTHRSVGKVPKHVSTYHTCLSKAGPAATSCRRTGTAMSPHNWPIRVYRLAQLAIVNQPPGNSRLLRKDGQGRHLQTVSSSLTYILDDTGDLAFFTNLAQTGFSRLSHVCSGKARRGKDIHASMHALRRVTMAWESERLFGNGQWPHLNALAQPLRSDGLNKPVGRGQFRPWKIAPID
ncbi:hypothetical protein T03_1633 [Trichinella britovi]|uniref:Uncharacterized protein n=1 Tax=Trichinella britovi TaxID=45882 RepID=A0A0V1CJF9_TRIBR|nr:hypothetical protein T03_1633 [Trichinella britovi]